MSIAIKHDKGKRFIARCGKYTVAMGKAGPDDEENDGMWPGQLFIAALGTCIAGYVQSFCERHKVPFEGLSVELDYESADSPSRATAVNVTLRLPGPVPEKYSEAILRVADQCYITQSIAHKMETKVRLEKDT